MHASNGDLEPQERLVLHALDVLARHQMSWICESFVHVLTLREWGERTLSDRINDEYLREVPRAFRAIELILELGGRVDLESGSRPYLEELPRAGRTVLEMRDRERASMQEFEARLRELSATLSDVGPPAAAALAEEARSSRATYLAWLSDTPNSEVSEPRARSLASVTGAAAPAWRALNRLYAHLNPAIEETCVQMFVLRQAGRASDAEQVWRDSYAYMLFAADLVRLFARRNWSLELTPPEISDDVEAPSGGAPDAVAERRQQRLLETTTSIATILADAEDREAAAIAGSARDYLAARLAGGTGTPPAPTPSFDAMLTEHSYPPS